MKIGTIKEIHKKFLDKELDPVDLMNFYLKKIEHLDSKYKVWVSFDSDCAIQRAKELQEKISKGEIIRALEGIPVAVKDIINTYDFPTQMGSPIWKYFTPGNDARIVYYIKDEGGIILGKTITAEFAVHALNETLNPHNIEHTPGTSSSGSAAAISLEMAPVAIGTQTAGSIIRPASFCGIYGCKPSFGLIPRTGMLKTTDSLDTVGFFTNWYEDLKPVFEVLRIHGPNFPWSFNALNNVSRQSKSDDRPWKVAFAKTHTWSDAPDYARNDILEYIESLQRERDIEIFEVEVPLMMEQAHHIHSVIYNKTLAYYFKEEYKKSKLVSPVMNQLIREGNLINLGEYKEALVNQNICIQKMDQFLIDYDIIISLSTVGEAPLRNETEIPDPALMWTMTHLPTISAPIFNSPNGLPFGVQFAARKYNDYLLFSFLDFLHHRGLIPSRSQPVEALNQELI